LKQFLDKGGKVAELASNETKSEQKKEIARTLHYSVHHRFYAKHTGVSVSRLRQLNRNINLITDYELNVIWNFIEQRKNVKKMCNELL